MFTIRFWKDNWKHLLVVFLILTLGMSAGFVDDSHSKNGEVMMVHPENVRYVPHLDEWKIQFSPVSTYRGREAVNLSLKSVKLDGVELDKDVYGLLYGDPENIELVEAGSYMSSEDLAEWRWIMFGDHGLAIHDVVREQKRSDVQHDLFYLSRQIPEIDKKQNAIVIDTENLGLKGESGVYRVEALFASDDGVTKEEIPLDLDINVVALNNDKSSDDGEGVSLASGGDGLWVAGDLHIHSNWSDGKRSVLELQAHMNSYGYDYVYLTDGHHTGELLADRWDEYVAAVRADTIPNPETTMFSGMETDLNNHSGVYPYSHYLGYGLSSISGLELKIHNQQGGIDAVSIQNPPGPSSGAIAHANHYTLGWDNWSVRGTQGMEIIVPAQNSKKLDSPMIEDWRRLVDAHMEYVFEHDIFPSPRSGSDYHDIWYHGGFHPYVMWTYVPEWPEPADVGNDYVDIRKSHVDKSLHDGHVSASYRGSLGYFKLDGNIPGSIMRNIPAGKKLDVDIFFRAVADGSFRFRIFRNNLEEVVYDQIHNLPPGQDTLYNAEITFPGGTHYYWLYVEQTAGGGDGDDVVYASPIFVSQAVTVLPRMSRPWWEGLTINWEPVANASDYKVTLYYEGEEAATAYSDANSTSYDLTSYVYSGEKGSYTVTLQAIGDGGGFEHGEASRHSLPYEKKNSYTIDVSVTPAGAGSLTGAGSYSFGDDVRVRTVAQGGYTFLYWVEDETVVSDKFELNFKAVADRELTAHYVKDDLYNAGTEYVLFSEGNSVNTGDLEKMSDRLWLRARAVGMYAERTFVTAVPIDLTRAEKLHIEWENYGVDHDDNLSVFAISEYRGARYDVHRKAVIRSKPFTRRVDTIDVSDVDGAYHIRVHARDDGLNVFQWRRSEIDVHRIWIEKKTCEVGVSVGNPVEGGSVAGGGTFEQGQETTVNAYPNSHYNFVGWFADDELLNQSLEYTFTVSDNIDLEARFALDQYDITGNVKLEGLLYSNAGSIAGLGTYSHGSNVTLTAIANSGYGFINWTDGGSIVGTDPEYSFKATGPRHLEANFGDNAYILSYAAGSNGSLTGDLSQTVFHGEDGKEVIAVPDSGYIFLGWSDGFNWASRTDTNVMDNLDVTAMFMLEEEVDQTNTPSLSTESKTIHEASVIITGISESNANVIINGGLIEATGRANALGSFSVELPLNLETVNNLSVTAKGAGKSMSEPVNVTITHEKRLYGDVTYSGSVSVQDSISVSRFIVGLDNFTMEQFIRADVNGDGKVNVIDAVLISRYIVGLIDRFPVDED